MRFLDYARLPDKFLAMEEALDLTENLKLYAYTLESRMMSNIWDFFLKKN